jgi:hypothetical protein
MKPRANRSRCAWPSRSAVMNCSGLASPRVLRYHLGGGAEALPSGCSRPRHHLGCFRYGSSHSKPPVTGGPPGPARSAAKVLEVVSSLRETDGHRASEPALFLLARSQRLRAGSEDLGIRELVGIALNRGSSEEMGTSDARPNPGGRDGQYISIG